MDERGYRDRKYPRVKEACEVKFRVLEDGGAGSPGVTEPGLAVNISGGGMCFSSRQAVSPGVMVALEMSIGTLGAPVMSLGRVVWCEATSGGRFDVGVEFWWIGWSDPEAQQQMLKYVSQKLKELGK